MDLNRGTVTRAHMLAPHFPCPNGHAPVGRTEASTRPRPPRPGLAGQTPPAGRAEDPSNGRLGRNLLRGRDNSIGGDLNVDDEGTE
jgi:hypothetical protein